MPTVFPMVRRFSDAAPSVDDVREMLRHIPSRPDYATWLRVASAVWAVLSKEEGCAVLAEWSPEESPGEYAKKWPHRAQQVGVATLVYLAQQGGFAARRHHPVNRPEIAPQRARERPPLAIAPPRPAIQWPADMHPGTDTELFTLAGVRHLPGVEGLRAASAAGLLYFCTLPDHDEGNPSQWVRRPAWFITDSARLCLLARRLDGRDWTAIRAKGWLRRGSDGRWPIGGAGIGQRPAVALVEGGPDLLALCHLLATSDRLASVAPLAMPSGSAAIAPEALPLLAGKEVFIFPDADKAGRLALAKWREQLLTAGAATVRAFDFAAWQSSRLRRSPKDLNEYVTEQAAGALHPLPPPPAGLCPICWASRVAATLGGPTCTHHTAAPNL